MQSADFSVFGPNTKTVILGRATEPSVDFAAVSPLESVAVSAAKPTDEIVAELAKAAKAAGERGRLEVAELLRTVNDRIASGAPAGEVREAIQTAREANSDGKPVFEATMALTRASRNIHESAGKKAGLIEAQGEDQALVGDERRIEHITKLVTAKFGQPIQIAEAVVPTTQFTPVGEKPRGPQIS